MALNINPMQTIYMPLLNEGVVVSRPIQAEALGAGRYKVLPTKNYDPSLEEWLFPPSTIVECRLEMLDGKYVLEAFRKVD